MLSDELGHLNVDRRANVYTSEVISQADLLFDALALVFYPSDGEERAGFS